MTYEIRKNPQFNSSEIYFDGKPSEDVRNALKALRFRWHGAKKCWYGYATESDLQAILEQKPGKEPAAASPARKAEPVNKYGVKVGDLFYASWGYEQTNVDFFQVIGLRGATSVLIREVYPRLLEEQAVSGMSSDRRYEVPDCILPPASSSLFVEDNENGDLKRVSLSYDGTEPRIKVGRAGSYQTTAYPYRGGVVYESWYY